VRPFRKVDATRGTRLGSHGGDFFTVPASHGSLIEARPGGLAKLSQVETLAAPPRAPEPPKPADVVSPRGNVTASERRRALRVEDPLSRLNDAQKEALRRVGQAAEKLSNAAYPRLVMIAAGMGYSEADVRRVLEFVRSEAEPHIYFTPQQVFPGAGDVISGFLASGRYQNQFETGISSGSLLPIDGRDVWEKDLFRGAYHTHPLIPSERPKYGVLNTEGVYVRAAARFGWFYLVLKPELRPRITLTARDSGWGQPDRVGTLEHSAHVLANMLPISLKAIFQHVLTGQHHETPDYREIQVHGPVEFAKDIARVVAPVEYSTVSTALLRDFVEKFNLPLFWYDRKMLVAPRQRAGKSISITWTQKFGRWTVPACVRSRGFLVAQSHADQNRGQPAA
jgi:hypothetical protein